MRKMWEDAVMNMIDFTKEELLVIVHDLGIVNDEAKISYEHISSDFIVRLRHKIQSLIDNYCEHEVMRSVWSGKCEKCGKELL